MRRYLTLAFALLLVLSGLGCSPASVDIIDYRASQKPRLTTVLKADTYSLWADAGPIESTTLSAGDCVGFICGM
jgi:hypothetical protein